MVSDTNSSSAIFHQEVALSLLSFLISFYLFMFRGERLHNLVGMKALEQRSFSWDSSRYCSGLVSTGDPASGCDSGLLWNVVSGEEKHSKGGVTEYL